MAEVFVEFMEPVEGTDGRWYAARACGAETADGMWQGWLEFVPDDGGTVLRSGRETTQPNRQDLLYWATGLTAVYLEGALHRAMTPRFAPPPERPVESAYDEPAPDLPPSPVPTTSVLNPFSVYRNGESVLRRQLAALSPWHLVNVIRAHGLSEQSPRSLASLSEAELIELIVATVRVQATVEK